MSRIAIIFAGLLLLSASSFAQSDEAQSLGDVARQTRQQIVAYDAAAANGKVPARKVVEMGPADDANADVRDFLSSHSGPARGKSEAAKPWSVEDFRVLEADAERVRSHRSRAPGGTWEIRNFYDIVSTPAGGSHASDAEWRGLIQRLEDWSKAMPDSYTAKLALAAAHLNWGWKARGTGYADSVPQSGWSSLDANINAAIALLKQPGVLNSDDPYRYDLMMQIATVSGMSKANMRELFNQAVAGEPDYYHYYRLYANYLQTKWAGAPGEAVAFAKTSADSVGGQKGDFIYFELASLLTCGCGSGSDTIAQFSWDRVKSGYSAMEGLYGSSMLKRNRMALMATRVGDVVMAQKMFGEIGESWDAEIWRSKWDFDRSKAAALAGQRLQIGTATGQGY